MKILLLLLALSLPASAQYAHRSNPGTPGATAPAITTAGSGNCPGTGCVVLTTGSSSTIVVKIGGTWTATLSFRCSNDNWATTASQTAYPLTNGIMGAGVTTTGSNGTWAVPTGGNLSCGVYCDAFTSNNSMTVNLDADPDEAIVQVIGVTGGTPIPVTGTLTNNNAAPGANNIGTLPCLANNAAQSWVEGDVVFCSVDLVGRQRIIGTTANDTNNIANGLETLPAVSRAGPSATTAGRSEKLQSDNVSGGVYVSETPTTNATGLTTTGAATVTSSVNFKASAGNVYGFGVVNGAGAGCWLQCVNSAGAGTLGTAVIFQAPLPTSATAYSPPGPIPLGSFSTGIACGVASAVGGASACGTAATGVAIYYK